MDVKHIAPGERVEIPYMVKQFFTREDLIGLAHKALQERKFLECQRHFFTILLHGARCSVHLEFANLQYYRLLGRGAAQHGVDARYEFFEREWLDDVVVGAFVEQIHLVLSFIACGEDDDGRGYPFFAYYL